MSGSDLAAVFVSVLEEARKHAGRDHQLEWEAHRLLLEGAEPLETARRGSTFEARKWAIAALGRTQDPRASEALLDVV